MAAIRQTLRHFCADDNQHQLRVGPIRSPAELEDLWAIDKVAYEEASITYERFQEWWSSYPLGLRALFFRNRVMGAIALLERFNFFRVQNAAAMPDHVPLFLPGIRQPGAICIYARRKRPRPPLDRWMSAAKQKVELVETKDLRMFIPVMQEIDFGDRFLLSMLHWCGFGRRSTPLDYWQVFILRVRDDLVGVSGLYRQPGMAQTVCWIGWFAIRPGFRRQGFGKSAMDALIGFAKSIQAKELWVYTGSADDIAVSFYKSLGFELLGPAADWAPGRTMDDSDIVLRRML